MLTLGTLTAEDDQSYMYMLEVDLEYPKERHDFYNDYLLAPETMQLNKVRKLVLNLGDKRVYYVVHYVNLKQYLAPVLKLRKIHRLIRFNHSQWLKKYINLHTALRASATTDLDEDFFKLMKNAMFGKTMENIRKRVDARLVTNEKQVLNSWPNPTSIVVSSAVRTWRQCTSARSS